MSDKEVVKQVVLTDLKVCKKRPFFKRPYDIFVRTDKWDSVFFVIIAAFIILVCYFAPYVQSPVEGEQIMADKYGWILGIAAISTCARFMFDRTPVQQGGFTSHGKTDTIYESRDPKGLLSTFIYTGIAFGFHAILSLWILQYPLSIFEQPPQMMIMTVTVAVTEELLFSYCLTGLFAPRIGWLVVPLVTCLFVGYHLYVYQASISALLYVGVMRVVYSTVYVLSRRISSVMLAHILNNLCVGLRIF